MCSIGLEETNALTGNYSNCSLEILSLADNHLGDEGFSSLSSRFGVVTNLREVYLQGNHITENAQSEIIQFIRKCYSYE